MFDGCKLDLLEVGTDVPVLGLIYNIFCSIQNNGFMDSCKASGRLS